MSSTYASSCGIRHLTRQLIRKTTKCINEEGTEKRAKVGSRVPRTEVAAEEEVEEDSSEWISSLMWETIAKLRVDMPLSFYKKYIIAPADQNWRLVSAGELSVCTTPTTPGSSFTGLL